MAMRLGLEQSIRPDLALRLSPQILQRIEVLQLPAIDLAQMVEQELQENETLELDLEAPEPASEDEGEVDLADVYDEELWDEPRRPREGATQMEFMEATAEVAETLQDHLKRQLDELELEPRARTLAEAIVAALDLRGWLDMSLDELDVPLDPQPTAGELEHVLHVVQALEPAGVGARDLTECLLLQLDEEHPLYDQLVTLIVQHLDDIAHNRIPLIARRTGVDVGSVLAAIEIISHLDPIPGRRFGRREAPYVRPDVVVQRVGEDYEISLENSGVPNVRVSRSYLDMASDRSVDVELRRHIRGKLEGARSLIEAIEQRRNTLFRVASELVNRQADFLDKGPAALRPLRMQEVADALGVHVSTVSRAISGKYIQVPRGILPMKSLFVGEVPRSEGETGEAASRTGVQQQVKEIIAAEDPTQPLSDEAIVTILKERHGLEIARRTVTKYRKALKIGSSRARRVYKT